jgi:Ser/Thr protein kinase RdoA (MazF antagonist)
MNAQLLNFIVHQFGIDTKNISFKTISQGYINDTFLISINNSPNYILQRINSSVFKDISGLHNNIENALQKLNAEDYEAISLLKTKTSASFYVHENNFWRILSFIEGSITYNFASNKNIAFEAGRIIARFHSLLKDEVVQNYNITIPNLNYLPFRIKEFKEALNTSSENLKLEASEQINFAYQHITRFNDFYKAKLPERICHNDTKLNNILFNKDNKGLCLIDLDTIMKGHFHYDFGDAVRTVVSETNEDEKDLTKIKFNITLLEHFIDGINSYGSFLNITEIEYLPIACALMPFMNGLRALTDYLKGNIFYKVTYENQNLDRCKSLFQFSRLALKNQESITSLIQEKLN